MKDEIIKVPDIGGGSAEIIEVCVQQDDQIEAESALIVLESDKASMEIPAEKTGVVVKIIRKVGDVVSAGDDILILSTKTDTQPTPSESEDHSPASSQQKDEPVSTDTTTPIVQNTSESSRTKIETIKIPDIGSENIPIIEICANIGDSVKEEDTLLVLESDKASMEIPAPLAGIIKKCYVKEGDNVSPGTSIFDLETSQSLTPSQPSAKTVDDKTPIAITSKLEKETDVSINSSIKTDLIQEEIDTSNVHAGPAVRRMARELGVNLNQVTGTGRKQRIIKENILDFVKSHLSKPNTGKSHSHIPNSPAIDFSQWGNITTEPLSRLRQIAARNFQASWLTIPHVTQFEDADITDLENFRIQQKKESEKRGTKLTILPFVLKACAYLLKTMPQFCASLDEQCQGLIYKQYINIGIAVDTPLGLLVPVIKDVDKKGLWELASECQLLAEKARNKQLTPAQMQGGCFTISSLGAIGGEQFTPIINMPEVAILGLSRAKTKPIWDGESFKPKLMLPLALSYDHRAINGAEGARFLVALGKALNDMREILL